MNYNPQEIEKKWQEYWEKNNFYQAEDFSKKPKKYILVEFPYPSGEGLHVGHVRSYSALDAVARKKRMEGFNVLYPIGWDAFGLPTENYAIKIGAHPGKVSEKNIAVFKKQLKSLGLSFDWQREINTTDSKYYRWTQWIFLKLFEKGLAYRTEIPINWCPSCKTGLANEEVISGKCERCGTQVEKKVLKQWMLKITAYADRLINDLKKVDYPERVKTQQINWIGKSYGTEVEFKISGSSETIKVFTTRIDTLFGVTAVVLAPEHPFVTSLLKIKNFTSLDMKLSNGASKIKIQNLKEIKDYIEKSKKKSDFEREKLEKEKTGVFTGLYCINPANNEKVPIWVGDYVVATYGGGAVMVVPAHDYRDYAFAKKYGLEIREVIINQKSKIRNQKSEDAFTDYGTLINSGQFNGLSSEEAIEKITDWLEKQKLGKKTVQYKLRDWIFSRQHYWGEPIPLVFCENCAVKIKNFTSLDMKLSNGARKLKIKNNEFNKGELLNPGWIAVPENDLPVELPFIEKYQLTGTGESPLATITDWVNTICPKCKAPAKRETDTMPNWAGSNWYFMRYTDPDNNNCLVDQKKLKYWMPVDWYNGGMEHTTLHLLYSRFIYKFLFDIGVAPQSEPYRKRTSHGTVLAEDGRKMSKSFANVINPDDIVKNYGADTLRVYEMFMGPFEQAISWSNQGVKGAYRFLEKVWNYVTIIKEKQPKGIKTEKEGLVLLNKTIKKVSEDLENCKFNTAVSALMELLNFFRKDKNQSGSQIGRGGIEKRDLEKFLLILSPFAPHIAEELWRELGNKKSIFLEKWPEYDPKLIKEEKVQLIIQINGKVRDKIEVEADISEKTARELTLTRENVKKWIKGKEIKKVIFVPKKLINFVI